MNIYKGDVVTVNGKDEVCRYLVEENGQIEFVGNELPDRYGNNPEARTIVLGKKALLPSFVDTHQHFASFSLFNAGLNVMEATSNKQILDMVRSFAAQSNQRILIAFGASPYSVEENRLVNRTELDSVCPEKPLMMVKYDGHACIINSPLLKKLEKRLSSLRGYHPDTGEMNQEAFFAVSDSISNSISVLDLMKNMQKAADYEASKGIGMVHTVSGVGFPLNMDITMEKLFAKSAQNGFQLRIFPQSMNTKVATGRHIPRIGGCFACALDGCFGSTDAALNQPYFHDSSNSGVLYYSDETVTDFCKRANRAGRQIEMHAIGDKAFDQASRALKAALEDFPREDHRHGIIHACLPTKEGLEICCQYHICLLMQTAFDNWRQEPPAYTERILGKERNAALNPVRSFADGGCVVGLGSDGPCTDPDPMVWISKAVNHSNPAQAVSVQQAVRMATYNGCYVSFDEQQQGSLEKGKIANMVILSENPYAVESDKLSRIQVETLILSGKEYRKQDQSAIAMICKGLGSKEKF